MITTQLVRETGDDATAAREEGSDVVHEPDEVHSVLGKIWWALALRGVLAVAIGLLFLTRPLSALTTLVVVFGAWALIDGVINLFSALAGRTSWQMGVLGVIGVGLGLLIVTQPAGVGTLFFVLAVAWLMTHAIVEIALGLSLQRGTPGRAAVIAVGVVAFLFGILLIATPVMGLLLVSWWIALYALFAGGLLLAAAFETRKLEHDVRGPSARTPIDVRVHEGD